MSRRFTRSRARKFGAQSIAAKAFRLAKKNQRTINQVVDRITVKQAEVSVSLAATPSVVALSIQDNKGNGRKAKILMLKLNIEVRQNLTSAIADNYRIDLVIDKRPTTSIATSTLIYGAASPTIGEFIEDDETNRFRLVKSWRGLLEPENNIGREIMWQKRINLIQEVDVDGQFGTQSSIIKNQLLLIQWTTATANVPTTARNMLMLIEETPAT